MQYLRHVVHRCVPRNIQRAVYIRGKRIIHRKTVTRGGNFKTDWANGGWDSPVLRLQSLAGFHRARTQKRARRDKRVAPRGSYQATDKEGDNINKQHGRRLLCRRHSGVSGIELYWADATAMIGYSCDSGICYRCRPGPKKDTGNGRAVKRIDAPLLLSRFGAISSTSVTMIFMEGSWHPT